MIPTAIGAPAPEPQRPQNVRGRPLIQKAATVAIGRRVRLPDGREGLVDGMWKDAGCGCVSVVVKLPGRDWVGRPSEVTVVGS